MEEYCEIECADSPQLAGHGDDLERVTRLVELFKALGDETRCRIVYALAREEHCVCDLAAIVGQSAPAVSHHLRLLRWLRLVRHRKAGQRVYYSLADDHVLTILEQGLHHVEEERP